jgi:hypothetical protein
MRAKEADAVASSSSFKPPSVCIRAYCLTGNTFFCALLEGAILTQLSDAVFGVL